jgi:fumarate hydratase class II
LEEIGQMTIADFRRLGNDPKERMKKIKDKLQLLREESFKKYQNGLDLWKKSPVYTQAVEIVKSALEKKMSLPDAIKETKTLTPEEFDAIINDEE